MRAHGGISGMWPGHHYLDLCYLSETVDRSLEGVIRSYILQLGHDFLYVQYLGSSAWLPLLAYGRLFCPFASPYIVAKSPDGLGMAR